MANFMVPSSPFFTITRKFTAAICRTNKKPCTTFVKLLPFRFSAYSNHRCRVSNLLDFDSFKCDSISFGVKVKNFSLFIDMLRFWPKEATLTLEHFVITAIWFENILIEGNSTCRNMTTTPVVIDDRTHVVSRIVIQTNAFKHLTRLFGLLKMIKLLI